MRKRFGLFLITVAACVAGLSGYTQPLPAPETRSSDPQYDAKGDLKRPTEFHTWVFVGANIGLKYARTVDKIMPREENRPKDYPVGDFHNVYINPEAYDEYVKTGKFPEKTVLVLDVYKARPGEPKNVVAEGLFPAEQTGIVVAVKNSARPDGSTSDWAYYEFPVDTPMPPPARAFPDKACYDCHLEHASDDNVWVQFYPVLRRVKADKAKR